MLAVLAAFFCLLFFAAAKKSRCRPAQGRRVNGKHHNADASAKAKTPNRLRSKPRLPDASEKLKKGDAQHHVMHRHNSRRRYETFL
jgi:hypothetical protein